VHTVAGTYLSLQKLRGGSVTLEFVLRDAEREAIVNLWQRKLHQDETGLPLAQRHRNLEPASAEFLAALAAGVGVRRMVEIGGSSGVSTIALACAARHVGGHLTSIEIEPQRQAESRDTLARLKLDTFVTYVCGDAANILPEVGVMDFAFIDCEKADYIRFFDMLRIAPGGLVVADNIRSHALTDYVVHVRKRSDVESITLNVGMGLEVTTFAC
jgi:caffeoyl-CoA O-methyltransferase